MYPEGLFSERLMMRHLTKDDVSNWIPYIRDKHHSRFMSALLTAATDLENAEAFINSQLKRYERPYNGLMALITKEEEQFVGICGLLIQEVDGIQELEIGYHLLPGETGKGYATEAARFFMNYAFEQQLAGSLISIILVENIPSQKVAERNGFTKGVQTSWRGLEVFIYRKTL